MAAVVTRLVVRMASCALGPSPVICMIGGVPRSVLSAIWYRGSAPDLASACWESGRVNKTDHHVGDHRQVTKIGVGIVGVCLRQLWIRGNLRCVGGADGLTSKKLAVAW